MRTYAEPLTNEPNEDTLNHWQMNQMRTYAEPLTNEPNEDIRWTTDKWTKWGHMLNHWQMNQMRTYTEPLTNEPHSIRVHDPQHTDVHSNSRQAYTNHMDLSLVKAQHTDVHITAGKSTQTTWTWVLSKRTDWCLHKLYILVSSQKRVLVSF